MRKNFRFFFILIILLFVNGIVSANEKKTSEENEYLNFVFSAQTSLQNKIENFADNTTEKKVNVLKAPGYTNDQLSYMFFWLGIGGSISTGVGLIFTIVGGAVLGYYYPLIYTGAFAISAAIAGAACLGIGLSLLIIGLVALIPGFVLFAYYDNKKASLSYKLNENSPEFNTALSIKL
jgi:hypothetical protein